MLAAETNLWRETAGETRVPVRLEQDLTVDLAIVGGGFTGCSAALHGARRGLSVALLEAHEIGHGGSGRNVGLVNAGLWLAPDKVEQLLGKTPGAKLNAALSGGPDLVFELIRQHAIKCHPVRAGTLQCAHAPAANQELRERHKALSERGAPVVLIDRNETVKRTGSPTLHGALLDPRAGTINPLAYCRGLARAAESEGATLLEHSPVTGISFSGDCWQVTANEATVRARFLLVATNAYHTDLGGITAPVHVPVRFFQMATAPLSPQQLATIMPGGEGCWDTATVMSSFRLDAAGRLVIGTIGSLGHVASGIHRAWVTRKLASHYPQLADIGFHQYWYGKIAMTNDHLPKIVRLGARGLLVHGYSGRGIAPGTIFGKAVAESFAGANDDQLPIAPIGRHDERFIKLRALALEAGATLAHLAGAR